MSKAFGVCVKDCDIIDDENNVKKLEISDLVQILVNIEENVFSIKIISRSVANLDTSIYTCNCKNIAVVSNDLVPFLVGAECWERLDILRFKKKIMKFKVGSTGNLQMVYDNRRYFIEFVINYIGPVSAIGEGFYVGINLTIPDIPNKKALLKGLYLKYNNRNDQHSSFTVGVAELFSEIELDENFVTYGTRAMQYVSLSKEQSIVDNSVKEYGSIKTSNIFEAKLNNEQRFDNLEPMEVKLPQDYSVQSTKTKEKRAKNNSKIMKCIEIDKLWAKNPKMCMICMRIFDTKGDYLIFSCNHKFCVKCALDRLVDVKRDKPSCSICDETLRKLKLETLNNFVLEGKLNSELPFENLESIEVELPQDYTLQPTKVTEERAINLKSMEVELPQDYTLQPTKATDERAINLKSMEVELPQDYTLQPTKATEERAINLKSMEVELPQDYTLQPTKATEERAINLKSMEVELPQDYTLQPTKATDERAKNNSEIMKRIDIDKLGKKNPKMCMICMKIFDTKGDLFIFSCNHKFCVKCVLDRLDDIKRDNTTCPICGETLKGKCKLEALNNFVQNSFSGEETCSPQSHKKDLNYNTRQKNDNKKSNYFSGNGRAFDNKEKIHSGSSGKKIEIRYCKNCDRINKYSDTFCNDCRRPLTANDYSFISVVKES